MQISRSPRDDRPAVRPGDLVHVRRARWRIVQIRACDGCKVVTLCGLTPPHLGLERRVLTPFDTIEPIERAPSARFVRRRWRRACRALIAADATTGSLHAAGADRPPSMPARAGARDPPQASARGCSSRTRSASARRFRPASSVRVARARFDRPRSCSRRPAARLAAGLTDRFAIDATGVDGSTLRRLTATLPIGVNPWRTLSTAVASIDYVKRPEVFPAAAACRWDVVVIDEAHACAGDSDRRAAVHALAARADYVLLLSATPHSGDREIRRQADSHLLAA
jgi:hypothetical protein